MKGESGFKLTEVCLILCMTMPASYNVRMSEYLRVLRSTELGKKVEVRTGLGKVVATSDAF